MWGLGLGLGLVLGLGEGWCLALRGLLGLWLASSANTCSACFCASSTCAINAWVAAFCSRHRSVLAAF